VKYGFEIETVTPLFVGGSNPREQPEIRAASFRGALRFWLRALLGGVLGDRPDNKIFQCESQVFGSTDYASPVVVQLEPHNLGSDSFNPLPHKPHKQVKFRFNSFKPGQMKLIIGRKNLLNLRLPSTLTLTATPTPLT
jgi:CRISPR-associated protein Cmr1